MSAAVDGALAAYQEALAAGEDHYSLGATVVDRAITPNIVLECFVGRCACGWTSERPRRTRAIANRSAGLHASAALKRQARAAAAVFDETLARLEAEAGR